MLKECVDKKEENPSQIVQIVVVSSDSSDDWKPVLELGIPVMIILRELEENAPTTKAPSE